jgi:hypothetical protein
MIINIFKNVPVNLLIYVSLGLVSYLVYELARDKIPNKWKHFILSRSFVVLIITFLAAVVVSDSNLKEGLFTFSSVYLGFWLSEQVKAQEERRKLKFFLGMIWQELRYNRVQLETLMKNYEFYMDDIKNIEIMYLKYSSTHSHTGFLKSTVYDSFVSSSVITNLKKDGIFNDLATAYTNMKFLRSASGIVLSDFEMKLRIHQYAVSTNGKDEFAMKIMEDLGQKIKNNSGKELAISYRSVCKAIESTDTYLNSMMVKSDEETKSDADLTPDDKKFIENILKPSPKGLPKNLFKD